MPKHKPLDETKTKIKPIRIVLVDDNEVVRSSLKLFFETSEDFLLVGEATDGYEAVYQCAKLLPDVILMDINMPKMNGIKATKIIHQRYSDVIILAFTASSDNGSIQKIIDVGAYSVLSQRISIDEITKTIRAAVDRNCQKSPMDKEQIKDTY